jgi:hypothetical protein
MEFSQNHLIEHYVGWLNDPEVVRYYEQRHHKHTLATCIESFEAQMSSLNYFLANEIIESNVWHVAASILYA